MKIAFLHSVCNILFSIAVYAGKNVRAFQLLKGFLCLGVKNSDVFELVAKEFQPHGILHIGREYVANVSADCKLTRAFGHKLLFVAGFCKVSRKLREVIIVALYEGV